MTQPGKDPEADSSGRAIAPEELSDRIGRGDAPRIVDLRSAWEYRRGHLPGAVHVPFWQTPWRASEIVAAQGRTVLVCGHGPRAWMAGGALRLAGHRDFVMLRGHMAGWLRRGLRVER